MNTFRIRFRYLDTTVTPNVIATATVDIGQIQSLTFKYDVTKTDVGIPSQPSQNAFIMDSGVTRTHTFSFRRINPVNPVDDLKGDSTLWSNGFWVYVMKRYIVNRWQAETDGCKIY